MKHLTALLISVALMLGLGAAPSLAQTGAPPPVAAAAPTPAPGQAVPITGAEALSYRLGPGDKLRVTTFNEPTLSGEFFVGSNGIVSLPLVEDLTASNLTVQQFRDLFVSGLRNGYLTDPQVSIEVLTYRPFYMLGEVNHPGEYAYTNGLTVINAVATAQGFTYRANTKKVFIRHQAEQVEREYPMSGSTVIQPGDTIRVVERFF